MITKGSRYKKATKYSITDKYHKKINILDFRLFVTEPSPNSASSLIDTLRFDVWAFNAYRDPSKWWIIADSLEEPFVLDTYIGDTAEIPPPNKAEYGY